MEEEDSGGAAKTACLDARVGGSRDAGLEEIEGGAWEVGGGMTHEKQETRVFSGFVIHTFNC